MKQFCIKLILGFANYFTRKDENVYDTFNLIVGRNPLILMFFILIISILIIFEIDPFVILHDHGKWERKGILLFGYLMVLPLFILIFPTREIKKVTLDEQQLKYYYRLNAIILFSLVFVLMAVLYFKKGFT
ncbi:MAG: hypothetical protein IPG48_11560 [Saprospiraceae bacterium]|jgi:hypothetical protein|nr:hypothetical protein [Saprospiraceae bacterium]MBK8825926.1 hypothetical protein [Saprospiraceae bacterium]MBK8888352.1 hypothetical protein [Saprospiraceae bacterium]HQV67501.1 hypothetical protein [Saprospiraceae bacterium]HQV96603.1 hypothetical protein [Saprospiraceae bacterium]